MDDKSDMIGELGNSITNGKEKGAPIRTENGGSSSFPSHKECQFLANKY